jgi:SH3-like domain-containing protein
VLTPNAFRTPDSIATATANPTPTTLADDTCRTINEEVLAVRTATDILAREVTILPANAESEIIGRTGQNTWWQIRTPDNRTGWVDASAVEVYGDCLGIPILTVPTLTVAPTNTPDVPTVTIKTNLNVRRGPSIRFNPPIGRFAAGDTAEIIAVNTTRDWYKVVYQGSQGWISGSDQFVDVGGSLGSLPVDPGPPTPTATNTPIPSTPTPTLDPNTNYLQDPSFEGAYTGRGSADLNIPAAWQFRYYESPRSFEWMNLRPVAFPHTNPPEVRSGSTSANINRGFATFTAAMFQQASVPANISVRARAFAWVHTCDPAPAICGSDASSGARVRIGIDPNGGTDPLSPAVVWSNFEAPHDQWRELSVSTRANGGTVTVFLYGTQDIPKGLNELYWDDAGLFVGG